MNKIDPSNKPTISSLKTGYAANENQSKELISLNQESSYSLIKKKILQKDTQLQADNSLTLDVPEKKEHLKQKVWRTNSALMTFVRSLKKDELSGASLVSLMQKAFQNRTPYVVAQVISDAGDCFYMDAESLCNKLYPLPSEGAESALHNAFALNVERIVFIGLVPWRKDGFSCGVFSGQSDNGFFKENSVLFAVGTEQHSWPRGLLFAQSSTGVGAEKDHNMAEFLFSKASGLEKKKSISAALLYSVTSEPMEIIVFLLKNGAEVAPAVQSDDFLPLTLATKAGRIDVVKLLLKFGADARQSASWSHGTALSWSDDFPEIKNILIKSLKGKDENVVLKPSMAGTWEPYQFIDNDWVPVSI